MLDKGHLKRNNKLHTALAEKSTLVRLGSGHPGIVRLHWAFQDDWSLCESTFPLLVQGNLAAAVGWVLPLPMSPMGSLSTNAGPAARIIDFATTLPF